MYTAKPIPTLTGEAAERFERSMQEEHPRIDLREAYRSFESIMQRSIL